MAFERELYQKAFTRLGALRQNAVKSADDRRREVVAKAPLYAELDAKQLECGALLAQSAVNGNKMRYDELVRKVADIEREKFALLKQLGFAENYLSVKYSCDICKDTGRAEGAVCSCVERQVKAMRLAQIDELTPLTQCTFDAMNLAYYPEKHGDAPGLNPRKHMQAIIGYCRDYANGFTQRCSNLLISGNAGLGKTHLALAMANVVVKNGFDVLYISSQTAFSQLERERYSDELLSRMLKADLLILDDLGAEYLSPFILSCLYSIVDGRMITRKATVYTTNIVDEELFEARYSEKIASRLLGNCEMLKLYGDDIRIQKSDE